MAVIMTGGACHSMHEGEILNEKQAAYPLYHAVIYRDRVQISKDPTLLLEGKIFLEGLVQAEEITEAFEKYINMS